MTKTPRPPLKERSPWLWGCQTVFLSFVALCVLIIIVNILYKKFDGFRMYHGEIEIERYTDDGQTFCGYYYARCYREAIDTEKHNLKKILNFYQDSSTWKYKRDDKIILHKHKMDYNLDDNVLNFDYDCDEYYVRYMENNPEYFSTFLTWAYESDDILPNYTKHLDDTLMTISFRVHMAEIHRHR